MMEKVPKLMLRVVSAADFSGPTLTRPAQHVARFVRGSVGFSGQQAATLTVLKRR